MCYIFNNSWVRLVIHLNAVIYIFIFLTKVKFVDMVYGFYVLVCLWDFWRVLELLLHIVYARYRRKLGNFGVLGGFKVTRSPRVSEGYKSFKVWVIIYNL